ncbi:MAG: VWA domain-containing protein [Phycisphaerales bacterium]|nr:VWA domain-containing protein [Phycisphaerales bacterium]
MNALFDWLFGFDAGTFGGQDSGIGFATPIPIWIWTITLLALGLVVWLSYRGLPGPSWVRATLGSIRWCVIGFLLVLALGPQIERGRVLIEPDRVIVLLDASGSMNMPEVAGDGSLTTRATQLSNLLNTNSGTFEELAKDSSLDVYTFTNRTTKIEGLPNLDPSAIVESAPTTLGGSIQSALTNAGTSPVSGIILFSDGQSHDEPSPALIESLLSSGIQIITVPIGSSDPVHDASIRLVESPRAAFAKDRIPFRILGDTDGYTKGDEILIELIDQSTGQTLASTTQLVGQQPGIDTDLSHTFTEPGTKNLIMRLTPQGASTDLVAGNNEQSIELRVVSEPMRVLYIDGHPRWEYRYLKNILMRENTINATTMLLASDRRFIEEGQPMSGPVPDSLDAWEPFDVVILGDVRPELFSESQLTTLKTHIETRGCGLLWIAGEGATPNAWIGSKLASLLPMQTGKTDSISNNSDPNTPVVMSLTQHASRAGLLAKEDGSTTTVNDPAAGWTILRWTHSIELDDLKPGVATLAHTNQLNSQHKRALVTTMRYGKGHIGYVGTDEIWRWRYGRGEDLPERFWLPMVRTLARGTIARRASSAELTISPKHLSPGTDVRVTLNIFDSAIIDTLPQQINATIKPLSTSRPGSKLALTGTGSRRSGLWTPNEPGAYSMSIAHPLIGTEPITQTFRVRAAWEESNNPNTDHQALASLSERTNGQSLATTELDKLPSILPNRTRITTLPPQTIPLWDRPIVLVLLMLLLSIEWIGRRSLRLA